MDFNAPSPWDRSSSSSITNPLPQTWHFEVGWEILHFRMSQFLVSFLIALLYIVLVRGVCGRDRGDPLVIGRRAVVLLIYFAALLNIFGPLRCSLFSLHIVAITQQVIFASTLLSPLILLRIRAGIHCSFHYGSLYDARWELIRDLLVAPIGEELIFRGIIYDCIFLGQPNWSTTSLAAGIFALAHWRPWMVETYVQVGFTFLFGIYVCKVYGQVGLIGTILLHMLGNLVGFPLDHLMLR
jgi:membrane protease YdiL (CAAX protease family)